jgi:hypothetical protein
MEDKALLDAIAFRLHGIDVDDLTTAEGQIADLLVENGYMEKDTPEGGWTSLVSTPKTPASAK